MVVPADLQMLIVAFIALQGWAISQHARHHLFFVYWAWGWFWLAVLIALGRGLPFIVSADLPIGAPAVRTVATVVGLLQLYCFALGAWALSGRVITPVRKRQFLAFVLVVGALSGYATGVVEAPAAATAFAFIIRHIGLALVFVYSAWHLYMQRIAGTGAALMVTASSLFVYGLHLAYYATADISTLIEMVTGFAILPYDSLVVFSGINWVIDMALTALLGIGALMLLISEMRRARMDIHRSEAEFRGTFDHAPIGMALLVDSGEILRANAALGDLLELPSETLAGTRLGNYMHNEGDQKSSIDRLLAINSETRRRSEVMLESGSGREIRAIFDISMLPAAAGEQTRFVAQILDTTEQHNLQEKLSHLAMHDAVTGLPNRAYLQEYLHASVKRMQRRGTPMAVMFGDLNGFKLVNDTYGHEVGDSLLQAVAQRLKVTLREGDFICRYGGDEFVIVIEESPGQGNMLIVARRIQAAVAEPIDINGTVVKVTVSLGVVISHSGDDASVLLREADALMYQAKKEKLVEPVLTDRSTTQGLPPTVE